MSVSTAQGVEYPISNQRVAGSIHSRSSFFLTVFKTSYNLYQSNLAIE